MYKISPDRTKFNTNLNLPYELRLEDFYLAMQDVYDFFHDVNIYLMNKGLHRLDDMLRAAAMSGLISDMLTASLAKHARALSENGYHNGHPDLLVTGLYPYNKVLSAEHGVEIKTTRKPGGAVDTHGARDQWMCVFVYDVDDKTEPAYNRHPFIFREIYLCHVNESDFRKNDRTELGTRTATLDRYGVAKLRQSWVYLDKI